MEINGIELELDIFDADVMAAYEQELATVAAQSRDKSLGGGKTVAFFDTQAGRTADARFTAG